MPLRFEEAPSEAVKLLAEIRAHHFPQLSGARIKLLFDIRKRQAKNRICLARIVKPNDLVKHLTRIEAETVEGFDYIITMDKIAWENLQDDKDRTRILRHELRHTWCDQDEESATSPYRLQDHTITDFYEEVDLNKDDPRWASRCCLMVQSIYEQRAEEAKEARARQNKRQGKLTLAARR